MGKIMAFSKSSIVKYSGFMMGIAITAVVVFMFTFEAAADIMKSLLAALAVSGLAGGLALIPVFYAVSYKPDLTQTLSLAAGAIRLLLTITGCVTLCFLANINFLWFFGWTAVFYIVILVIEIRVALAAMDLNKTNKAAQA
jgi:hypothetical protein